MQHQNRCTIMIPLLKETPQPASLQDESKDH